MSEERITLKDDLLWTIRDPDHKVKIEMTPTGIGSALTELDEISARLKVIKGKVEIAAKTMLKDGVDIPGWRLKNNGSSWAENNRVGLLAAFEKRFGIGTTNDFLFPTMSVSKKAIEVAVTNAQEDLSEAEAKAEAEKLWKAYGVETEKAKSLLKAKADKDQAAS